jgi:hypothetical protein
VWHVCTYGLCLLKLSILSCGRRALVKAVAPCCNVIGNVWKHRDFFLNECWT